MINTIGSDIQMITRKEGWLWQWQATFAALFGITARGWKLWLEHGGIYKEWRSCLLIASPNTLLQYILCILQRSAIGFNVGVRRVCISMYIVVVVRKQRVRGTETPVVYQPLQWKHKQWPLKYFAEFLWYIIVYVI